MVGSQGKFGPARGLGEGECCKNTEQDGLLWVVSVGWPDRLGYADEKPFLNVASRRDRHTMVLLESKRKFRVKRGNDGKS